MSREEGVKYVKKHDHIKSKESLNYFLEMIKMSEDEFDAIADNFRDKRVWWIEDNKWWKDTLWGEPECYGEVKLKKNDHSKYYRSDKKK